MGCPRDEGHAGGVAVQIIDPGNPRAPESRKDRSQQADSEQARTEATRLIVHDLRSPLNAVLGYLRLAQDMIAEGGQPDEILELVQVSSRAAESTLSLVELLLDIDKLEEDGSNLHLESVSLQDVAAEALTAIKGLARAGNLTVQVSIGQDVPLVIADQSLLQRVLTNLLDNAIRYTPDGGQVRLEAQPRGRFVEVRVADTGPGIPAEARACVFDKFYQGEQQPVRGHKGSGLGLAFCRLAVEAHGGVIWAAEGPEGGALIAFTLPADPDASILR